jgi:predicted amidohydrolase YtcJ
MIRKLITGLVAAVLFYVTIVFIITKPMNATMVLVNGTVYTLDPRQPVTTGCAIRGSRILEAGPAEDLLRKYTADTVIDCTGQTVIPGFTDAHAHVNGLGMLLQSIILVGAPSVEHICTLLSERLPQFKPGEWIYGRGWDQNLWQVKEFPNARMLDAVAGDNPVVLIRIDGHASWVNTKAMQLASVNVATPDPPGGKIIRDREGNPTGVFLDNARELVESHTPLATSAEIRENILRAARACVQAGLTEVGDMGLDSQEIAIYRELADEGKLPLRIYGAVSAPGPAWTAWSALDPLIGYAGGMLTIRAMKLYTDGALGSRGAAMIEPYSDDPGNRGLTEISDAELDTNISMALRRGYQPCIHAIGDWGNHIALNAYARARANFPEIDGRPRIEHAQVICPEDIPRFRALNVLPSMQPVHATSDMPWAEARIGPDRIKGAYAWRSLLNTGVIIPGGSDFPNDGMYPLWGFYAAITRSDRNGNPPGGWYPDQRMNRTEALRAYTQWAAYAAFQENQKGTIEPGKWADLTVLSQNIMAIPADKILSTEVTMTIVNGRIVHQKTGEQR